MPREIDATLDAELTADAFLAIYFFELATTDPAVFVRLWNGTGDVQWDGKVWNGIGAFGTFGPIEETANIQALTRTYTLTGVRPSDLLAASAELRQGLPIALWSGAIEPSTMTLLGEPLQIDGCSLDEVSVAEGTDSASIRITGVDELIDLDLPRIMRFTSESQKLVDDPDEGFNHVSGLQDKTLRWGNG